MGVRLSKLLNNNEIKHRTLRAMLGITLALSVVAGIVWFSVHLVVTGQQPLWKILGLWIAFTMSSGIAGTFGWSFNRSKRGQAEKKLAVSKDANS